MCFVGSPHRTERARETLIPLGWTDAFENVYLAHPEALGTMPGRVVRQEKTWLWVHTTHGQVHAMVSGRLRHRTRMASEFPVIGDWVLVPRRAVLGRDERTQVLAVLARATLLARQEPGQAHNAQALASNVDDALIVVGLDQPPNVRWLERAVALATGGNVAAAIVLNKIDTCANWEEWVVRVQSRFPRLAVCAMSAWTGAGIAGLDAVLRPYRTAVLVGLSGAGKSSLLNRLLGSAVAATGAVRPGDFKGRHTTTHRELFRLPQGSLLIDGPGIREFGLWTTLNASNAFGDVLALAEQCQFRSCSHQHEPGCAVQNALQAGQLEAERLASFSKLEAGSRGIASPRPSRRGRRSPRGHAS